MSLRQTLLSDEDKKQSTTSTARSPLVNLFVKKTYEGGVPVGSLGSEVASFLEPADRQRLKNTSQDISGKVEFKYPNWREIYMKNVTDVLFKPCCSSIKRDIEDEMNSDDEECPCCACMIGSCFFCIPLTISTALAIVAYPVAACAGSVKNATCQGGVNGVKQTDKAGECQFKTEAPKSQKMY